MKRFQQVGFMTHQEKIVDLATALSRLDNSPETLAMVIRIFQEDIGELVVDLRTAFDQHHLSDAKRFAHTIKSMAAGLDAHRLVAIASRIELQAFSLSASQLEADMAVLEMEVATVLSELERHGYTSE